MRLLLTSFSLFLAAAGTSVAQPSPYAGQEQRPIKALSAEQIEHYLSGAGMGFARAAELNHYPGPKHVLELVDGLQLSVEQIEQTQAVFSQMQQQAVALGSLIVERERQFDTLFGLGQIDDDQIDQMSEEIALLQGRLRATHLRAHIQMKQILSDHQAIQYDRIRGYSDGQNKQHHPGH